MCIAHRAHRKNARLPVNIDLARSNVNQGGRASNRTSLSAFPTTSGLPEGHSDLNTHALQRLDRPLRRALGLEILGKEAPNKVRKPIFQDGNSDPLHQRQ